MTIEETRLQQEYTGTRPAPTPCSFGLCQHAKDHTVHRTAQLNYVGGADTQATAGGHSWLDAVAPSEYNGGR